MLFINKKVELLIYLWESDDELCISELSERTGFPYPYCHKHVHAMDDFGILDIFNSGQGRTSRIVLNEKGEKFAEKIKDVKETK